MTTTTTKRFECQVKERQEQNNTTASEDNASDPGSLRVVVVVASGDDIVCVLTPPPQHARVTVTRAVEVGELGRASKDDGEGIAACN